jgi:hypothetical protein
LHAELEKLALEAEDCELIAKLSPDLRKRGLRQTVDPAQGDGETYVTLS